MPKEITYPEVALFFDCDCYDEKPSAKRAETFFESALKTVISMPKQLAKHILEE